MVLYRPREEQRYYYGADQTEVYWVHFTGNNVKNFLRRYGIADDTRIIYTGISIEYKNLFMSMIEELNLQRIDYEEMLINYFMILLISLHRIALQKPRKKNLQNMNDMEQATQYFRMHYNKPISIEDYAVSHNMSISWFIQNFRQYANTTPAQYVQSLRLTNAKMLLETTNYNITEIETWSGTRIHYISAAFSENSVAFPLHSSANSWCRMQKAVQNKTNQKRWEQFSAFLIGFI